jgi:hypothetical protein
MDESDYPAGRKPSFGYTKQGQPFVRGFRSKPGAPQANPFNNVPMSQDRMTPKGNWDSMFKNSLTGNNPLSPEARAPVAPVAAAPAPPAAFDTAMNEIMQDEQYGGGTAPPPSLSILSAGGPTHAQSWGGDSLAKNYSAFGANVQDVKSYGGIQRTAKNKYGWGSSYLPTA